MIRRAAARFAAVVAALTLTLSTTDELGLPAAVIVGSAVVLIAETLIARIAPLE